VAIRHNVSSRGIEDAVAISTKIFILEIAAAGVAGLATTKCRVATLPSVTRNDNRISDCLSLSVFICHPFPLSFRAQHGMNLESVRIL